MSVCKPFVLLFAVPLALACSREAQPEREAASKTANTPANTPPANTPPANTPPPAEPELLSGVGPSGAAGRSARRQAVLDLLTDGDDASSLPIHATDPGEKFDPRLAEKLAPKMWVSDGPSPSAHSYAAVKIDYGPPTVDGGLDRDIVRRIVRAHLNEVRSCYNAGLSKSPKLTGRVTIEFQILGSGKVSRSAASKTTLSDEAVGHCIAKAVKRWTFPKPRGGDVVEVVFPFELAPG